MSEQEKPKVPESFTVNTGEEEYAFKIQDEFFSKVLSFLGFDTDNKIDVFTKVERNTLNFLGGDKPIAREDGFVMLIVKDRPVASAVYWRNMRNWIQVAFAAYLDEYTIERTTWRDPDTSDTF